VLAPLRLPREALASQILCDLSKAVLAMALGRTQLQAPSPAKELGV